MDLGERLKAYAITHVRTISREYEWQTLKWKAYLNLVADAQIAAQKHVQDTLDDIKRKQAEADQLMLIALSLIGIAGASWLGAMIEIALFPRFAGKIRFDEFMTSKGWRRKRAYDYSQIAATTFGHTVQESTGTLLDQVFEGVWPKVEGAHKIDPMLSAAIGAGKVASFKTSLDNALLKASTVITAQLGTLEENINQYQSLGGGGFGDALARAVEQRLPRPRGLREELANQMQERNGQRMLDEYFDTLRHTYAREWFYFGNNPTNFYMGIVQFQLELETWALWILNQTWEFKKDEPKFRDSIPRYWWESSDGFELRSVMHALEELAGEELRNNLELQAPKVPIGASPLKNQPGWVEPINPGPEKPSGSVQEINPVLDDDEAAAKDVYEAAQLKSARDKNTRDDMDKVLKWAKTVPGKILHGELDYRARKIGSLADIASVFAD